MSNHDKTVAEATKLCDQGMVALAEFMAERTKKAARTKPANPVPGPTTGNEEAENDFPTPPGGFLQMPQTFGDDFVVTDYLIDGILQRGFCYSLTAQTGTGKTVMGLRKAAHVAIGRPLGNLEVERGKVLYLAGENPEDVKMRWFGLTREMGIDPKQTDVIFIFGAMHLSKTRGRIEREIVAARVKLALIVVDTAAAFFEGDNDNDNVQAGNHARALRSLRHLPGNPTVLVLCHPTKNAKDINEMVPRGGGAFLNEVDGNIGAVKNADGAVVASSVGKFRGPEFPALHFALKTITDHPRLLNSKGRHMPTVICELISYGEVARREEKAVSDDIKVLRFIDANPGKSLTDIATGTGWNGAPATIKSKVNRIITKLIKGTLLLRDPLSEQLVITADGQKSLNRLNSTVSLAVAPSFQLPSK
ncbi:AAA family ATPase [Bradyrhizobium sp. 6(2017)]|uniref:AAA family ATPase n=1 Tax=Bradyrhizobium sp. 6(2017) TaxID=1197460 RepID=UPI0013E1AAF1|nr:AAA family ATPase [Bradyrhizobium sp. 6(2017)]QIG92087.1 AAA family ATPase [Bradyrhizobium sp. 6(2017)]